MANRICTRCGGRRIPIPGWKHGSVHPTCLPDHVVVWTDTEQREWLARRAAQNQPVPAAQRAQNATRGPQQ